MLPLHGLFPGITRGSPVSDKAQSVLWVFSSCPEGCNQELGAKKNTKNKHSKASRVLKNQVKLRAMQKCKDETISEPRLALRTLRFAAHRSVPFQFT